MNNLVKLAEKFAMLKHKGQSYILYGKKVPYAYHCFETRNIFLRNCDPNIPNKNNLEIISILHDIIEDTDCSYSEIKNIFGEYVANGVLALTKNKDLPHDQQIVDSINRIKKMPLELGAVKMSDRICNLIDFPTHWSKKKCLDYIESSKYIYKKLKNSDKNIAKLLKHSIKNYITKINISFDY